MSCNDSEYESGKEGENSPDLAIENFQQIHIQSIPAFKTEKSRYGRNRSPVNTSLALESTQKLKRKKVELTLPLIAG